jgi:DNA-binding NtrC family response regulator
VVLPPLRNRPREIAVLARTFSRRGLPQARAAAQGLRHAALPLLAAHPGWAMCASLKNVVEFLVATSAGEVIDAESLRARLAVAPPPAPPTGPPAPRRRSAAIAPDPGLRRLPRRRWPTRIRDPERARMQEALRADRLGGRRAPPS